MQQRFLLQILLVAQHVSGTICPSSGAQGYYTVVAACGISLLSNILQTGHITLSSTPD